MPATKLRMAYITDMVMPSTEATTEQLVNNVTALAELKPGWEITIIAPRTEGDKPSFTKYYGVMQEPLTIYVGMITWLPKSVRKLIFAFYTTYVALWHGFDIVYTRHPSVLFFSLLWGHRSFFDTYRTIYNTRVKYRLWRMFCYSRTNLTGVIAHSELCRTSFIKAGLPASRVITAYNGCNVQYPKPKQTDTCRMGLHIPKDAKVVCYAGRIHMSKGTDMILELAKAFPDLTFLIVGGSKSANEDEKFSDKIHIMGLRNVVRTGWVEPAEVLPYLQASDFLLIPPTGEGLNHLGNTVLPLKSFLYLQAGKPIVAADLPDLREVFHHGVNALLVRPDAFPELKNTLAMLLGDRELQNTMALHARQDSLLYTWPARARKIAEFIQGRLYNLNEVKVAGRFDRQRPLKDLEVYAIPERT